MNIKFFKKVFVFLFFSFIGFVYLHNLTRDIYSGDIGDLVTAAYVFGVAHPPGYPLFSLIGYVFSHLPINLPVVSKVGLISVISSLAGLIIYFKFCQKMSKSIFISLLSTSILAFSYFYWLTAEIPEGLALNNFFVIVILFLAIRFYEKKKAKDLYLLALFIGLSLTHQLFILTLFPAIFILIIKHYKFIFSKKRFLLAGLCFLAGLAVYIYVPIAASRNPPINWDNAVNLKNFLHLVLRKDYGGISYGSKNISLAVRMINVSHYLKMIISVFSYQILLVAFLGFLKIFKIDKRLFFTTLIAFLLTGVFTIFINAGFVYTSITWGVAERYYSVSTIVLMFVVPYGFILIKDFLNSKFSKPIYSYLILSYFIIVPFLLFKYNFPKTNLSKTEIGNTLARNIFVSLPKNSVLFISGDNSIFTTWYVYYVLKERQDINIIHPGGNGNNPYLHKEINDYYKKNPKTELKYLISDTLNNIRKKRRMFTTYKVSVISKGTILVPKGLVSEIINIENLPMKEEYLADIEKIWQKIKIQKRKTLALSEQNFIASEMPFIYSNALVLTGDFLMNQYNDPKEALEYYKKALLTDDTNSKVYSGLAKSIYKSNKDCDQAIQFVNRALSIYPFAKEYYFLQYNLSEVCMKNNEILKKIKNEYKSIFKEEINNKNVDKL